MGENNDDGVITMSVAVLNKLVKLNEDAKSAVSLVGGNSVQDSYRDNTIKVLDEQHTLLEVFVSD